MERDARMLMRVGDRRIAALAVVLAGMIGSAAWAHAFAFTEVLVVLKLDRLYQVDVRVDLDALALGVPQTVPSDVTAGALRAMSPEELADTVSRARELIRKRVHLRTDQGGLDPHVGFPEYELGLAANAEVPSVLGVTARLSGVLPKDAKEIRVELSRAFGPVQLAVFEQSTGRSVRQVIGAGAEAPPFVLERGRDPGASSPVEGPTAWRYLVLGYEHIVPLGLDHILFVCGLFLLSPRLKPLLWQTMAFTVAHSVTLALAMLDVVALPARVVEPLIAASITYVAVENLLTAKLRFWRPIVVFCFGLLHGLGFAGALREVGLPDGQILGPLLMFNLGVEIGQLSVVLGAVVLVGWFRRRSWYRACVTIPGSIAIALVGAYWCWERALG